MSYYVVLLLSVLGEGVRVEYVKENAWVWAGTGLVLLTLSGVTLRNALFVTVVTILVHGVATFLKVGDSTEDK